MAIVHSTKWEEKMLPEMRASLADREVVIRLRSQDEAEALAEADLHPQFLRELRRAIDATWPTGWADA